MRIVFFIVVLLNVQIGFSQEWRDSLEVAREAYKNEDYEKTILCIVN